MRGRWLRLWKLVLGCLALAPPIHAQRPAALRQLVQLPPGRRPLGTVLAELARQSRLPLSYSNSLVPLGHRTQVRPGPPRPLDEVLREVLAGEHLAYGLLDGQLVVWPGRVAPPPGITYLNGQLTPRPPGAGPAAPATGPGAGQARAGVAAAPAARPVSTATSRPGSGPGTTSAPSGRPGFLPGRVRSTSLPAASARQAAAGFPVASPSHQAKPVAGRAAIPAATRLTGDRQTSPAKRATPGLAKQAPPTAGPGSAPASGGRKPGQPPAATRPAAFQPTGPAARQLPGAAAPAGLSPGRPRPAPASRELSLLTRRPVTLEVASPPTLPATLPAGKPLTPQRPASASLPPNPPLRGLYLHAEAWGSESLPLGLTGKVGVPRLYLVLGAALADNGRQSGPAVGLGLGTAGRARSRFTPNLDLLAWRVGAGRDREEAPILLAQLRPQLSWQVRRGGRLALVAGPTLNLATAHQRGPQLPRWDFGRDQWLWVNHADDESLLRLWPGVQVGVRF